MAFIPVMMAITAAMSAASAIQQGRAASANSKSQANIADYNAQVAENNAVTARQQAVANEESQRRQAGLQLGKMRAGIAEAGGGLSGSSGDLYAQSLATADLDAKNIMYMGELKAGGAESEAELQRYGAVTHRSNAKSAMQGAYLSAAGKAFSAVGSYYSGGASMGGLSGARG